MGRNIICVGVWKDRLTYNQSVAAATKVVEAASADKFPFECGIAPSPFSHVATMKILQEKGFHTVAQNVMWHEDTGSYIGEVTVPMLQEQGTKYVILGHSERRLTFGETDEIIGKKFATCVSAELFPIVCIGDTAEDRKTGNSWNKLSHQIAAFFDTQPDLNPTTFALAYEPVWAISTWRNDEPLPNGAIVEDIQTKIRTLISEKTDPEFAESLSILYGGSVNPDNGVDYLSQPNVDGALIGGASKTPESYLATLEACKQGILSKCNVQTSA